MLARTLAIGLFAWATQTVADELVITDFNAAPTGSYNPR